MILRLRAFQASTRMIQARTRRRRMDLFQRLMGPGPQSRILDLGGTPSVWSYIRQPLDITILNLPGNADEGIPTHHKMTFVEGDACAALPYPDGEFDIVFSNSVIEHVGGEDRQAAFAANVRRLGRTYYVQTPAPWFPIEAHTGMPFWWLYPESIRRRILAVWHTKLPAWSEAIADTRVLTRRRLASLFPNATIYTESLAGIPKSYTAFARSR
jgi:methyltransferase family protein